MGPRVRKLVDEWTAKYGPEEAQAMVERCQARTVTMPIGPKPPSPIVITSEDEAEMFIKKQLNGEAA